MNRLPDHLPDRVDTSSAPHLLRSSVGYPSGADSIALDADASTAITRVGKAALQRLASLLTEREFGIVESVSRYRYLTGRQIQQLHFNDHASDQSASRTCRRVLQRLIGGRLLHRAERRVGGVRAGSASYVYGIGQLGHRLVSDGLSRGRWKEPSTTFLDHTLAIGDFAIACLQAERKALLEVLQLEVEPTSWRTFSTGLSGSAVLKPDLFVAVGLGEFEDRWFVEIDRATESTTAVLRKVQLYLDYQATGVEQQRHDVFPRVLWVVPNERRARQLRQAFNARMLSAELLTVCDSNAAVDSIVNGGPT